jgi:hypothetical protein
VEPANILMGQQGAPAGIPVDGRQDNEAKKIAHGKVNFPGQPTLASPLCIDGDNNIDVTVGMFEFNGHRYKIDLSRAPNLAAVCNKNKEARCAYACRSKCLVRSKEVTSQVVLPCYTDGCNKMTHPICSLRMTLESKGGEIFYVHLSDIAKTKVTVLLCGKECHNKYKRIVEDKEREVYKKANSGWTKDASNGSSGLTSSMDVPLNWITDERNCDRYFGSHVSTTSSHANTADKAITKHDLCKEIVQIIQQEVGK